MTSLMKYFSILVVVATAAYAQAAADYCILSEPGNYTIFNEYEQPLSTAEKDAFLSFSPLLVTDPNVTLGDQITRALKFEFQRHNYYLLKGDNGTFVGEKAKNGRRLYKDCQRVDDTVEILGRGVTLSGGSGGAVSLEKGTRLNRIFESGGRFYALALGGGSGYGWCSLEQKGAWRKTAAALRVENDEADSALPASLKARILDKVTAANEAYKAYFAHFNTLTKDAKSAPVWRCEGGGSRFRCVLSGPAASGDQLSESTQSLVLEMENVLLGTAFAVRYGNGEMVIERRPGRH